MITRRHEKLAGNTDTHGVAIDEATGTDLVHIMEEEHVVKTNSAEDSFQRIFWEQQSKLLPNVDLECVGIL